MSKKTQRQAARSRNGVLGTLSNGPRKPVELGRGALTRAAGTLGGAATVGPLSAASGGFGRRPSAARTPSRRAFGALGATGTAPRPSNLRPRPGRGANGVLALAATPYYTAMDRIRTGYAKGGRIRPPLDPSTINKSAESVPVGPPPLPYKPNLEQTAGGELVWGSYRPPFRFTKEQQSDVMDRLRAGESIYDVARAYDTNAGHIQYYLQRVRGEQKALEDARRRVTAPGESPVDLQVILEKIEEALKRKGHP